MTASAEDLVTACYTNRCQGPALQVLANMWILQRLELELRTEACELVSSQELHLCRQKRDQQTRHIGADITDHMIYKEPIDGLRVPTVKWPKRVAHPSTLGGIGKVGRYPMSGVINGAVDLICHNTQTCMTGE